MCGGEARAGGGRGRLRRAGPENPKKAAAARALGPAGSCRGHLQRGRAAGDRRGNKSPPPRSRRAASGAYPAPRAQSVPASGPPQGAVGARAAGGPSPHVAHAQLSGEGGPETPGLASVAPEVAGFFPPPPKKAFLCVWEETAPACRSRPCIPGLTLYTPSLSWGVYPGAVATTCWVKAWFQGFPVTVGYLQDPVALRKLNRGTRELQEGS